jgi:hypothetical protein
LSILEYFSKASIDILDFIIGGRTGIADIASIGADADADDDDDDDVEGIEVERDSSNVADVKDVVAEVEDDKILSFIVSLAFDDFARSSTADMTLDEIDIVAVVVVDKRVDPLAAADEFVDPVAAEREDPLVAAADFVAVDLLAAETVTPPAPAADVVTVTPLATKLDTPDKFSIADTPLDDVVVIIFISSIFLSTILYGILSSYFVSSISSLV